MPPPPPTRINLAAAFAAFDERWSPRVAAELNGQQVKLAKLEGPFVWHHHRDEDELFLVIHGRLTLRFRDGETEREPVTLEAGEMLVVPRGVEHLPVADGECHVLLFEPAATLNTGNVENARTVRDLKRV